MYVLFVSIKMIYNWPSNRKKGYRQYPDIKASETMFKHIKMYFDVFIRPISNDVIIPIVNMTAIFDCTIKYRSDDKN